MQTVFECHIWRWNDVGDDGGGDERRFCFFVSPDLKIALAEQASKAEMQSLFFAPFSSFFLPLAISTHPVNDACDMNFKSDMLTLIRSGWSCPIWIDVIMNYISGRVINIYVAAECSVTSAAVYHSAERYNWVEGWDCPLCISFIMPLIFH